MQNAHDYVIYNDPFHAWHIPCKTEPVAIVAAVVIWVIVVVVLMVAVVVVVVVVADLMFDVLTGITIEVFADVNANSFAVVREVFELIICASQEHVR